MVKKEKNILRLKIDFEGFKLEVVSNDPNKTLAELNNILNIKKELLESLIPHQNADCDDYMDGESFLDFELRKLSYELRQNKVSMDKISNFILKYKSFLYRKELLDSKHEVDLNNKKFSLIIEKKDLSFFLKKILYGINLSQVKHILVHIISDNFTKEQESILIDEVKKRSGLVDVDFHLTKKKINGIVVEALIFGDFPHQEY